MQHRQTFFFDDLHLLFDLTRRKFTHFAGVFNDIFDLLSALTLPVPSLLQLYYRGSEPPTKAILRISFNRFATDSQDRRLSRGL